MVIWSEFHTEQYRDDNHRGDKSLFINQIMRPQKGSIVEMTLTSYSHKPMYNFHHPMHIHGHEFYVMQKGYGKIDWETMNLYPNGSHPAFECTPGEPYCATTRQA